MLFAIEEQLGHDFVWLFYILRNIMVLLERTVNKIENIQQLQPLIIACVFPALATVAVLLRFVSKRIVKAPISTDDYMILVALV